MSILRRHWFLLAVLLVVLLGMQKTYRLHSQANSQLVCNEEECFLFVAQGHRGWRVTYVGVAWSVVKGFFWAATPHHHFTSETAVFRITEAEVEDAGRFKRSFHPTQVHNDTIYGYGGGRFKWTGTSFQRATAEEDASYAKAGWNRSYSNRKKWVRHHVNLETEYPVTLGNAPIVVTWERDSQDSYSIKVARPFGGTSDTIFSWQEYRTLSRKEYAGFFSLPD